MVKNLIKAGVSVTTSLGMDLFIVKAAEKYLPKIIDMSKLGTAGKIGIYAGIYGSMFALDGFTYKGVDIFVDSISDSINIIKNPRKYREDEMTKRVKEEIELEVAEEAKEKLYEAWMEDPDSPFDEKDMEKYMKYKEKLLTKRAKKKEKQAKKEK